MRTTVFFCVILALAGCGTKGQLVLPPAPTTSAPAATPAPASALPKPAEGAQ